MKPQIDISSARVQTIVNFMVSIPTGYTIPLAHNIPFELKQLDCVKKVYILSKPTIVDKTKHEGTWLWNVEVDITSKTIEKCQEEIKNFFSKKDFISVETVHPYSKNRVIT